ncbi:MAG: hypothetical protein AAB442_00895 [Patescibacteria group bacterium]
MEGIPDGRHFAPTEQHNKEPAGTEPTGEETTRIIGGPPPLDAVEPHRHTDESPLLSLEELGSEGVALLSTKSYSEFHDALVAYNKQHHEDLLGVSAEEVEMSVNALTQNFEKELITQGLTSSRTLQEGIQSVVDGLGLPNVPELRDHFKALVQDEVYRHLAEPGLIEEFTPKLIEALNRAQTLKDFDRILRARLPATRARLIVDNLMFIEGATLSEIEPDPHAGNQNEGSTLAPSVRPETISQLADEIKNRVHYLPVGVDSVHIAQLLLEELYEEVPAADLQAKLSSRPHQPPPATPLP